MNFPEIENAVKHLKKVSTCLHCKAKYTLKDIHMIAATSMEGLFEMKCPKCKNSTIVTVILTPKNYNTKPIDNFLVKEKNLRRTHQKISRDDVLDVKNFLNQFDGDFSKIFKK